MTIFFIAVAAVAVTFLGGALALYFRDKLHLILGFSAGAIISVAFFDLLPEALALAGPIIAPSRILTTAAFGFFAYLIVDRLIFGHCHEADQCHNHRHVHRGRFGAGSLSVHSFLDGLAIGLAFQVSLAVGAVVAVAVLTHDFSDGINTVSTVLRHGGSRHEAFKWLAADALAPAAGVLASTLIAVPAASFAFLLSLFAGFFLYLGASDLLPESHHSHPTLWTTATTILGVLVMYAAIALTI